jgi:uncharacterized protein
MASVGAVSRRGSIIPFVTAVVPAIERDIPFAMTKPTFTLLSPETGTEYSIYVERPRQRGPWGVVLFMDGDDQFTQAVKAYRSRRKGSLPPLLLIGVGYGASYTKPANRRARDYTPVRHKFEPASGGADAFLRFLTETLWPELRRRYPLDAKVRGLGGHSLGSLLVLHALFQPKPFFTHHLASAPSIWWANRAILRQARKRRMRRATLPAKLFLAVGGQDSPSMTGDLARLEKQLADKPFRQLEVMSHRFPGRDHYNSLLPGFSSGLAALFGP